MGAPKPPSPKPYLDSQVAGNSRPLYPKVDHHWLKVAPNYEPLALQVSLSYGIISSSNYLGCTCGGPKPAKLRDFHLPQTCLGPLQLVVGSYLGVGFGVLLI